MNIITKKVNEIELTTEDLKNIYRVISILRSVGINEDEPERIDGIYLEELTESQQQHSSLYFSKNKPGSKYLEIHSYYVCYGEETQLMTTIFLDDLELNAAELRNKYDPTGQQWLDFGD